MNDPFQERPTPALLAAFAFVGVLTVVLVPWNGRRLPRAAAADTSQVLDERPTNDGHAPVAHVEQSLPASPPAPEPVPESL